MTGADTQLLAELLAFVRDEQAANDRRRLEIWERPLREKLESGWTQPFSRLEPTESPDLLRAYVADGESRFREGDLLVLHDGDPIDLALAPQLRFETDAGDHWLLRGQHVAAALPAQPRGTKLDLDFLADPRTVASDISVRLVNGVAGSGKTLIAVRRALLLTERFSTASVLLLIHNTPIVADLVARLCRAGTALPSNLEVLTFSAWAFQQWRRVFRARPQMPATPRGILDIINRFRTRWPELAQPAEQLLDELNFINDTLIRSRDDYQHASRTGRGFALRPKDRLALWSLHEAVSEHLRLGRLRLWSALLEAASGALASLGRSDDEDFLMPDFGEMREGLPPRLVYATSPQDATDRLVNELRAMTHEHLVPLGAALVMYGRRLHGKRALYERLTQVFGATNVWWSNTHTQKKRPPGWYGRDYLRIAYVDSATGLEAPFVFLIGAEDLFADLDGGDASAETRASKREEHIRKRYMAMTRAGQRLVLIASRHLPAALERLFEVERAPA